MKARLKTETNTKRMESAVRGAARKILGKRRIEADFEHGQWWVTDLDSGAQWSVVDAEGGRAVNGLDFEQVTDDEEAL